MNTNSWNTTAVDKFLKLTKTARDYNSKEVKISIQDAEALAMSLALMLNQERELTTRIMQLQDKLLSLADNTPTNINVSGGTF
jgi:hypothetical protein